MSLKSLIGMFEYENPLVVLEARFVSFVSLCQALLTARSRLCLVYRKVTCSAVCVLSVTGAAQERKAHRRNGKYCSNLEFSARDALKNLS